MPVTQKYPTTRPALLLNFARSRQLDPRMTFSRASTGTRVNASGLIETVPANIPRFTFNPVTLASEGLMIEESRTNVLTYSEQFDNATWVKGNTTVSSNVITAPDGTLTGDKLIENTATDQHVISQTFTPNGSAYRFSIYLKAAERSRVEVVAYNATNGNMGSSRVDLSTGTVVNGLSDTINPAGNGWYRVLTSNFQPTNGIATSIIVKIYDGNNFSYTGNGTAGIYIWGGQLENGIFETSYIPTTASQVTRSADLASMSGTGFSSWFNDTQGTFIVTRRMRQQQVNPLTFRSVIQAIKTSTYNSDSLFVFTNSAGQGAAEARSASSTVASLSSGSYSENATIAFSYALNNFNISVNGGAVSSDVTGALPTGLDRLIIGAVGDNNVLGTLNGTVEKIFYYNTSLTAAQMVELTK